MPLTEEQVEAYRDRIALIGDMFLNYERQFLEFDSYVPYKYNFQNMHRIVSFRLYSLLQGINSGVENACKTLIDIIETDLGRTIWNKGFFTTLDQNGALTCQRIALVDKPEVLAPFDLTNDVPPWWTAYNKSKHEVEDGVQRSTLRNVALALGGLLCVLHMSKPLLRTNEVEQVLDKNNWHDHSTMFADDYKRLKYESATTASIHLRRPEFLHSQLQKYKSECFYSLSEYSPKHASARVFPAKTSG